MPLKSRIDTFGALHHVITRRKGESALMLGGCRLAKRKAGKESGNF
jgi:hypothetical protein